MSAEWLGLEQPSWAKKWESGSEGSRAARQKRARTPACQPPTAPSKLTLIDAPKELTVLPWGGPFPAFSFTGVEENLGTAAWGRTTNHTGVEFPSHEMSTGRSEDTDGQTLSEHREKTAGLPIPRPGQPWAP